MRCVHAKLTKKKEKEFFFVKIENRCSEITFSLNVLQFLENLAGIHNNYLNHHILSSKKE